ncbi:MAG: universal stress protein [Rhodospirillaceae bacterium]|nr:MAG: universal stress protein [Rhodospirillaceae bacterium]
MTENAAENTTANPAGTEAGPGPRKSLVVVDNSAELKAALRFACRRAVHTGGLVALFYALPSAEFQHFASVRELMEREARNEAEQLLQDVAADVHRQTGTFPALYIREGDTMEQLLRVIAEDPSFSVLVLGAGTGSEGPGPLVSAISGRLSGKIRIPVTIVPGDLDTAQIDALS